MGTRRAARQVTTQAREFNITRVMLANVNTGETFRVPNLHLTVRDLQAIVTHCETTTDLICETCGDSVADCIELAPLLTGVPMSWSWTSKVGEDF